MLIFPETKFDFCGDEYIYAEISTEMRIESNFKVISITNELRKREIPGMIEIYPGNASYLIRYDPNAISPHHLLDYLREIDQQKSEGSELSFNSRIIEIPVWYNDSNTKKTAEKYQHLQPEAGGDDFTYVMKANGFTEKDTFITAHSSTPYFITSLGFQPGTAWGFPLGVAQDKIIQAPKYKSPRAFTPSRALGIGGAFTVVYPSDSTGSYQLIGMSAVPVYDPSQSLSIFQDSFFLAKPGDLWKYRPVTEAEYYNIREEVKKRTYRFKVKPIRFFAEQYDEKGSHYILELMEGF